MPLFKKNRAGKINDVLKIVNRLKTQLEARLSESPTTETTHLLADSSDAGINEKLSELSKRLAVFEETLTEHRDYPEQSREKDLDITLLDSQGMCDFVKDVLKGKESDRVSNFLQGGQIQGMQDGTVFVNPPEPSVQITPSTSYYSP